MKALVIIATLFLAVPALADYTPATIETHCILKQVRDLRYRLTISILESRNEVFVNEARLNDLDRRLFSTINQTNEVDTEESYLGRLRTALPELARRCARGFVNTGKRPPPY